MSLSTPTMWRWIASWTFQRAQTKTERYLDLPLILYGFVALLRTCSPVLCKCLQQVTLYLVKWCSLPYEDSTWELKADIDQSKIEEYERIAAHTPNTNKVVSILYSIRKSPDEITVVLCIYICRQARRHAYITHTQHSVTKAPPRMMPVFVWVGLPPAPSFL